MSIYGRIDKSNVIQNPSAYTGYPYKWNSFRYKHARKAFFLCVPLLSSNKQVQKSYLWSSILAGAIISPSFTPKASFNTLELRSRRQFTEGEADVINDSFRVAQQVTVEAKNRANSPGLLTEQQLYLSRIWYFVL